MYVQVHVSVNKHVFQLNMQSRTNACLHNLSVKLHFMISKVCSIAIAGMRTAAYNSCLSSMLTFAINKQLAYPAQIARSRQDSVFFCSI